MDFELIWQQGVFGALWLTQKCGIWVWILGFILAAMLSYLLGSLNFGLIISQKKYHEDIRSYGSGNAGMTNMLRTYGKNAALFTLLGDASKTALAVLVVGRMCCGAWGAYVAGLFCIIGHVYPVFFGFRGGKGVVATAVLVFCLNPFIGLIEVMIFAALVAVTRYVSLGSILCMLIYPFLQSRMVGNDMRVIFAMLIAAFVIFQHRSNILRLYHGTENKISLHSRKQKKSSASADASAAQSAKKKQDH